MNFLNEHLLEVYPYIFFIDLIIFFIWLLCLIFLSLEFLLEDKVYNKLPNIIYFIFLFTFMYILKRAIWN